MHIQQSTAGRVAIDSRRDESGRGGRAGSLAVAAATALAIAGPAAQAAPIEVYVEGTVLSGSGPSGDLAGQSITGRFVFDTDLAPEDSFTAADDPTLLSEYRGDYIRSPVVEFQWIASDFRVGGRKYVSPDAVLPGGYEAVQVLDFVSPACLCFDQYIAQDIDSGPGSFHNLSFNLVRFLSGPGNFLDGGQALEQYFVVDGWGAEDWRSGAFAHAGIGANGTFEYVGGSFRLDRVVAAPLGERSLSQLAENLAVLGPGLAALAGQAAALHAAGNQRAACAALNAVQVQLTAGSGARFDGFDEAGLAVLREDLESALTDIGCGT